MSFFLYILQSQVDQSLYIGQTNNLADRISRHNMGRSKYTKAKLPWSLLYYETFETRSAAVKRERYLKSLHSKQHVLDIIHSIG